MSLISMTTNIVLDSTKNNKIETPILITFGVLFIVLGLILFTLFPVAKQKGNQYKQKQLELYKEKYGKLNINYEDTNMYLPSWEKIKVFAPIFFGLVFIIIGIGFLSAIPF